MTSNGEAMKLWAHRGSHGPAGPLENTIAAFEKAIDDGADGIELDVHLARDEVPIVFHDETLARLTPDADPRRLETLTAATLCGLGLTAGYRMPRLADVLDLVLGRLELNIELKDPRGVEATARLLNGRSTAGVMISSFAPSAVFASADILPDLPRALIVEPALEADPAPAATEVLAAVARVHATHWHPHHSMVRRPIVEALGAKAIGVNVWTVNSPAVARRMASCGVDGIMTDRPAWMRAALGRPL